jgi:hypothetical protein
MGKKSAKIRRSRMRCVSKFVPADTGSAKVLTMRSRFAKAPRTRQDSKKLTKRTNNLRIDELKERATGWSPFPFDRRIRSGQGGTALSRPCDVAGPFGWMGSLMFLWTVANFRQTMAQTVSVFFPKLAGSRSKGAGPVPPRNGEPLRRARALALHDQLSHGHGRPVLPR